MKMIRLGTTYLVLLFLCTSFIMSTHPDTIVGTWLNGSKRGHVLIYKQENRYFGKIIWLLEPNDPATGKPRTDVKNSDKALRTRPIMGMAILRNLQYEGNNLWHDGRIYNPEDGKEYRCKMTLKNPTTLEVRGFIGFSLFGKSQTWTRVK